MSGVTFHIIVNIYDFSYRNNDVGRMRRYNRNMLQWREIEKKAQIPPTGDYCFGQNPQERILANFSLFATWK